MEIHSSSNSTQLGHLGHGQPQQQPSRQRRLSVYSAKLLRRSQRACPSSQKCRDRRPYLYQVFPRTRLEGVLTGLSLASVLIFSGSFTKVFSQLSSQPPANGQSTPSLSSDDLMAQAEQLFATPDSLGAIAIGVAEGTRTPEGGRTPIWRQHTDPGNFAENRGTFSWQLEASSVADAEQRGLKRIRQEAIPHLLQDAKNAGVSLNIDLLVQGADLWNQSPQAGADFVENLQRCQQWETQVAAAVLCARVESYVSPRTGEVEAAGFANDLILLRDDQRRRMQAIQRTLQRDPQIAQVHQNQ